MQNIGRCAYNCRSCFCCRFHTVKIFRLANPRSLTSLINCRFLYFQKINFQMISLLFLLGGRWQWDFTNKIIRPLPHLRFHLTTLPLCSPSWRYRAMCRPNCFLTFSLCNYLYSSTFSYLSERIVLQISNLFTPVVTDLLRYPPFISLSHGNSRLLQR
jgi:hypothetical protein